MTVQLIRPAPYLTFTVGGYAHRVDVVTKDIGCTIGTELRYGGVLGLGNRSARLVAYRPGTRYSDRAEECAVEHLTAALERARVSSRVDGSDVERLAECLTAIVQEDGCNLWDPYAEEDGW
jgi:hypothetical protein